MNMFTASMNMFTTSMTFLTIYTLFAKTLTPAAATGLSGEWSLIMARGEKEEKIAVIKEERRKREE